LREAGIPRRGCKRRRGVRTRIVAMKRRNGRGAKAGRETDAGRAWRSKEIHNIGEQA